MKTNELPAYNEAARSPNELIRQVELSSNDHRRDSISPMHAVAPQPTWRSMSSSRSMAGSAGLTQAQQEVVAWIGIIAIVAITFCVMWLKACGWQFAG